MKLLPLNELFNIKYGNGLDLTILQECKESLPDKINYVSRTRENNGVSAFVQKIEDIEPFEPGLITVAGSGNSVLESFIQPAPFYTGYHVFVLEPKQPMTDTEKLFYCYVIRKNQFKYNFGRQANKTLKELLVPSEITKSFQKICIEEFRPPSSKKETNTSLSLDTKNWKTFKYGGKTGIFDIKNGYYNKKPEQTIKGNIPFIGATAFNNGITGYYSRLDIESSHKDEQSSSHQIDQKIFKGNCITVSNNGSVGFAFFQEKDFTCSHDINVLYLKGHEWNKYIALFICTLIKLERFRWAYGRKWRPIRMPHSEIRLPITSGGNPDWKFMENYVKSLPYSSNL